MTNNAIQKRFISCFICKVDIGDKYVELTDASNKYTFMIDRSNKDAMDSFMSWFKNSYIKCIPQSLVIIDYSLVTEDDEQILFVNKLIASLDNKNNNSKKD